MNGGGKIMRADSPSHGPEPKGRSRDGKKWDVQNFMTYFFAEKGQKWGKYA